MTKTQELFSKIYNFEPEGTSRNLELTCEEVKILKDLLDAYI